MTPNEMRFQIHLVKAILYGACSADKDDWGKAQKHMVAAEALIEDAEDLAAPAAGPVWCLKLIESQQPNIAGKRYIGETDWTAEGAPDMMIFPTKKAADEYARNINLWRVLESTQYLARIEPIG